MEREDAKRTTRELPVAVDLRPMSDDQRAERASELGPPKSVEDTRNRAVEAVFNGSERIQREMQPSTFNKLEPADKFTLASEIGDAVQKNCGIQKPYSTTISDERASGVYKVGGSLQIKIHRADTAELGRFSEAIGRTAFECYQREVVQKPGEFPEVQPKQYDEWFGAVNATLSQVNGAPLKTKETDALIHDIRSACPKEK